ncbi:lysosomal cobalamin transporter ABCD4-like [Pollicipes pollicipes]|uniref:lysosomal cobalamin transporter ABCD4-like n=1 Tax=Pollicipes pollicipes TaxID=41117 RepID=UPI0018858C76|nr:lysosomal cobalamin transporter ABCD4-like [Pollicipes pollicipes]
MRVQCPPEEPTDAGAPTDADAQKSADQPASPAEEERTPEEGGYGLDRTFCRHAWALLKVMFPSLGSFSVFQLVVLLIFSGSEQYVVYWVGIIPSRYYQVLGDKDWNAFGTLTAECLGLVLVISFVKGSRIYISTILYVTWRQLVDRFLHRRYFTGINYYLLNVMDSRIDNPVGATQP